MGNEQSQVSGGGNRFGFRDDADPRLFQEEVLNCVGNAITLGVWSAKGQMLRNVTIPLPAATDDPTPLGVSLKWMNLAVAEDVWHVLDIPAGSPAETAGLLPYSDYIIGTPRGVVHGESGLGELVEDHIDRPLQLYVYNHEFNVTREVTILPRKHWGGDGALGCVLGYGALHRLPPPLEEPLSQPGEALFEYPVDDGGGEPGPAVTTANNEATFITPAFALQNQPTSPPPQQFLPPGLEVTAGSPPPPSSATPPVMMDPATIAALQTGRRTPSAPPLPPPMSSPYEMGSLNTAGTVPPRSGRTKARGARNNRVNLMDAYMQEEENKSKQEDYMVDAVATTKSPPPPPGGSRPPPPR
ncbi:hypothetical protein ABW20_dc0103250 [Dactylellina cionopaga]|nr:hypothetical protein ABW20_dc0103250 [Dactylellina cionopaga]